MARILVTGVAGLIGGEVAARLVERGHAVTGLTHRGQDPRANDGTPIPSVRWGASAPGAVTLLQGDLARERFGWDEALWRTVAASHDQILHCAAVTDFNADPALHRAVNVEGTARVLELAEANGMALVQVSTAYVCGTRDGEIGETDAAPAAFTNGYEASKAAAEALVRASPVPWTIARPSIVVGDHASGVIRSFDTIYTVLKLFAEGLIRTMPARADATLDLVPIDHVARGLVALVEQAGTMPGATFHLVSDQPTPVDVFSRVLAGYPALACPRFVAPDRFDPACLSAVERRFHDRIATLYAGYFARAPRFSDRLFRAATGLVPPHVDEGWYRRLVDHCLAVGFVRPGRAGA